MHQLLPHSEGAPYRAQATTPRALAVKNEEENTAKNEGTARPAFRVLIADRDAMSSDLLATALARDRHFNASAVSSADLSRVLATNHVDLVVIGSDLNQNSGNGFALARSVAHSHPGIMIVILLNQSTHDSVINSFRSGARGVFSREQPMADFLDCVEDVSKGIIWAGRNETTLLLDAFKSIPSPSLVASDTARLTERESQVVHCAAKGKTNKVIASELGLSEHTVKNYLFRAFEKLGVSNRVELLFYLTLRGQRGGADADHVSGAPSCTDELAAS